jgi:hypothetical protein
MRHLIVFLIFSVSAAASESLPGIMAGPFTNRANGHLYFLLEPASWTNAELAAVELGGHLATINDAAEDEWVFSTFVPHRAGGAGFWIGLTDRASEGNFVWVNGENAVYQNWGPGEPNNFSEEDFGCYFTTGPYAGKWNDCGYWTDPLSGIVEIGRPLLQIEVASIQLTWGSTTNRRYQIQYTVDASSNTWSDWGPPIAGEDGITHITISTLSRPRTFYRVVDLPN